MTWRLAAAAFAVGLPGALAMTFLALPVLVDPATSPVPLQTLQLATLVQSVVLLAVAAVVGAFLGDKVGLRAPLLAAACGGGKVHRGWRAQLVPGMAGGVAGALVILGFHAMAPDALAAVLDRHSLPLVVRVLYGGVTEEVLLRWGLMTLFAWAGWRLVQRRQGEASGGVMWVAIALSALIFGVSHVPSLAASLPEATPGIVLYVTAGNALFGVVAGYLFWRRGLEAAIVAHVLAHVTAFLLRG